MERFYKTSSLFYYFHFVGGVVFFRRFFTVENNLDSRDLMSFD